MNEKEIIATSTIKLGEDKFVVVNLIRVNRKGLAIKNLNVEESISENPTIDTVAGIIGTIEKKY